MQHTQSHRTANTPGQDSFAFGAIFLLAFSLLFVVALLARLGGLDWREWLPGAESASHMGQGVKSAVYTFMNHII